MLMSVKSHPPAEQFRRRIALTALLAMSTLVWASPTTTSTPVVTLEVGGHSNATPWVAAAGSFVAVAWGASTDGKADVFVAVSRDSGQTFSSPVQVNAVAGEARLGGEMPPRVALARKSESAQPDVVVLWTARDQVTQIRMARSGDGGKTFSAPATLPSEAARGDRGWPALTIDRNGVAQAIWLDHRGLAPPPGNTTPHTNHQSGAAHDGAAMAQKSGLYYVAMKGSPSAERELTKGVCYCCKTALASGPDGALYAAWRHVYPGNLRDMAFTVSRDGGKSFSAPVRVSEDGWAIEGCPDDGPAMAVDARNTVHIVWPTVVSDPDPEGALFYASTRNGRTFTRRIRIPTLGSPKPSHPQIVIDSAGRIVVAWDESVDGKRVAAARVIKVDSNQRATFGDVIALSSEEAGLYPVLAATNAGLIAVWTTGGSASAVRARTIRLP
jgi:hypothetical protein